MHNSKPILLVEDDCVDAMTVKRVVDEMKIANELVCTTNGEEALEYLKDGNLTKPSIILLDLNMPKMDGFEFLRIAKEDSEIKKIPGIVLTTSKEEQDVVESFNYSVAGYMVKPVDYEKFMGTFKTINLYWTLSELPDGEQDYGKYKMQDVAGRG